MRRESRVIANFFAAMLIISIAPPARAEDISISAELTMHYKKAGTGALNVVLVPGWTMSSEVFDRQLTHFSSLTRYTIYAIDPRGQGKSTKTENGYSYKQRGKDLDAFVQKLGLANFVLAGWSYGSLDVLSWVDQSRDSRLKGLILIDGPPKTVGDDNTKEWVWYNNTDSDGYRRWFTMGAVDDRAKFTTDFVTWMLEDPSAQSVARFSAISLQTSDTVAGLTNETGAYANYTDALKALDKKVPLLFVVRDEVSNPTKQWAKANTPSATVTAMGKHLMFWERADAFNMELEKFLAQIRD